VSAQPDDRAPALMALPPVGRPAPPLSADVDCFDFDADSTLNDGNHFVPVDAGCAAGLDHVLVSGNGVLEWRTISGITGTPEFQSSLKNFFGALPAPNPDPGVGTTLGTYGFNPRVLYDQYAGRFIVVMLERWDTALGDASNQSRILLAVSKTSNPNDGFWFNAITSKVNVNGADSWADFPGLAVDDKAIYLTANMFQFGASSVFQGVRLWIINKTNVLSGPDNVATSPVYNPYAASGVVTTTTPAHMFGTLPAGSGGHPLGTFLVAYSGLTDGVDEYVQVIEVTDPVQSSGGPFFAVQQVDVGDIENPSLAMPNAQQYNSTYPIETNDRRMLNAVWRDNNLYCTATIRGAALTPDANQATVRWWRLDTTTTTSVVAADAGNIGGESIATGTHTFYPAIMVDGAGNMAVGFSASGPTIYCGAYYATRLADDPAGTTSLPSPLVAGTDFYVRYLDGTSNRWGDYSGLALSASGEVDFWAFNQYAGPRGSPGNGSQGSEDGRWQTRLGTFRVKLATAAGPAAARTSLAQNVPNPFNPVTTIGFSLAARSRVTLTIFDVQGRRVRTLVDGARNAGSHQTLWDGRDDAGQTVASGVYVCRLSAGNVIQSRKLVLLK
ncbi:MAG TPA: FlgD immunoglobulin-like domain containing protein, partial [Candidatus Krumholzibacteria bacterium]|nr:FlgD immunoglobulin-like domain containing protein [Candidatus Krumholzibacteria bacterium]